MKINFLHLFILSFSAFFQLHAQSNFENLALSGNASQSSTNPGVSHEASRAIDDNTAGVGAADSIAETEDLPNSYWQVELTQNSIIDHITLFARYDCDICLAALSEYTLEVLDENGSVVWSQYFESTLESPSFSRTVDVNVIGKTVRVVRDGRIYIAEAQVFGSAIEETSTNLALSGEASQSSTNPGVSHEAFRAIDDNTTGVGAADSIAETEDLPNSHWQVALAQNSSIDYITLFARYDCDICLTALSEYTLEVLDENGSVVWSRYFETTLRSPSFSRTVNVNVIGETVRVVRDGRIYIAEAQVFGSAIEETNTNLAISGIASQSSTSYNGVASRAIDNNTNGRYRNASVTHTDPNELNAWWQVELAQTSEISEIQIYNRTDNCCADRLSNYIVEVLDESGSTVYNQFFGSQPADNIEVLNLNVVGKIIRIRLYGILSLAEVQIFGTPSAIEASIENDSFSNDTNAVQSIVTYPNPVTENIFIELQEYHIGEELNVIVFNYNGTIEASETFLNNYESIINMDLSNLEEGFYILQIQSDSGILESQRIYVK